MQAPLHNDCVLKLHRAFQIFGEIHKFHLEMSTPFGPVDIWRRRRNVHRSFHTLHALAHSVEAETNRLSDSMERSNPPTRRLLLRRPIAPTTPYRGS